MALLVGELYALLLLERKAFTRGLKAAQAEAKAAGGGIASSLMGIGKVAAVGLAALVVGLGAVGVAALHAAVDFERGMASIQTLIGKGSAADKRIQELGESVKQLSITTGKSFQDIQKGLYDVIGTFTDTADSAKWLEVAVKAGAAGLSTTHDAVLLLGAVTKAFGDTSVEAAQKAADLVFETANLGVTTFPEMAASMGKVLPIAAALKVEQEELFGAMAALTGVTGDTALVTTQLRSVMNAFLKPNTLMRKAIEETGYASGQAMVESLGLSGALDLIAGTSVTADRGIAAVFGRVESLTAVLALNGEQAEDWAWKTTAMYNAAGRSQRAFDIQQQTAGAMMDRIGAAFGVLAVNIGNKLMPAFKEFLRWLEGAMPTIQNIVLTAVDAISAGVGIAAGVIGWFVDKVATVWSILGDLGMQGPIIAAAVGLITAAFVAWGISAAGAAVAVIAATWPVLAIIAAIAVAVRIVIAVFEHFGISVSDVFEWIGAQVKETVHTFVRSFQAIADIIGQIPGPMQGMAEEWEATLDRMARDVEQWGVGDELKGKIKDDWYNAAHGASEGLEEGLKDSDIYAQYKAAGANGGEALISELVKATEQGMSFTEEQLMDLGITADEALAAGINVGEPMVMGAVESLVEKFGTSLKGVKLAAKEAGGGAMSEMAAAISAARTAPLEALDTLKEMMKTSLSPTKEVAKQAGILFSKTLAKGLKDKRPDVLAQAVATAKLSIERLQALAEGGGKVGKKAMKELKKGMKSQDPVIKAAATAAVAAIESKLDNLIPEAGRVGAAAGRKLSSKLQATLDAARFSATVRVTVNAKMRGEDSPHYATGAWRVPQDQFAFIHEGEMVVPAAAANRIRKAATKPEGVYSGMAGSSAAAPLIGTLVINPGNDVSRPAAHRFGQQVLDAVAGGLREQRARQA